MGTRADFYIGRGSNAVWLASIAWDGYPADDNGAGIPPTILGASTEKVFLAELEAFLKTRDDVTYPKDGWPWPWEDSRTTDYAYAWDGDQVWASDFGHEWFDPTKPQPEDEALPKTAIFPDMSDKQNVTLGPRSGIIILGSSPP